MTTDEDRQLHALLDALAVVAEWEQLTGQPPGAWQIEPTSDLAGDDMVTYPYQVSSAACAAITAAVSHASCLRDSLFLWQDATHATVRLHTHGQLTLLRGTLENASLAIWLLEPDDRATRVLRRLQQERSEVKALENVRTIAGSPSGRATMQERMDKLSSIAQSACADPAKIKQGQAGYQDIVEAAGKQTPYGPKTAVFIWKACSAIAHGEFRALPTYLTTEALAKVAPGVALHRVTVNVQLIEVGTKTAIATTKAAFDLYSRRAHARD
jgi:hypothetical protein